MKKVTLHTLGMGLVALLWGILALWAWLAPAQELSESERRPLDQRPPLSVETLLDGSFMTDFESASLDQFPLRDTFRQVKSLFHYHVLHQGDNNGIYLAQGYAAKQEYPLREDSLAHAMNRFRHLYEKHLKDSGSRIHMAIIPDKGYYLAGEQGQLALDYDALFAAFEEGLPWAEQIDLRGSLSLEDYYRTDIHWRQENLLPAAEVLCSALGVTPPDAADYTAAALERPFYGVYYGQAALPMEPDTMQILESPLLADCRVYDYETGSCTQVYNMEKLAGRDLYDVFLSGPRSLLTLENPRASTDRELILFRDSFGSAIAPLLVQDYARVTLVDIRYIQIDVLDRFLDFDGRDVLLLYSVPVLNNSQTIK